MQLRKSVTVPTRFVDEELIAPQNRNGTKPAYPALLKDQAIPFNPDNLPATFPSRPLTSKAPPTANTDESEEATSDDSETLNPLSDHGLCISLAGGSWGNDGQQQLQYQASNVNLTIPQYLDQQGVAQQNVVLQDEATESAAARATSDQSLTTATKRSSIASKAENNIKWTSLPLSLQYRIYASLSAKHPAEAVIRDLGLTENEAAQILNAVGLRALHPASLAKIWDYCVRASADSPGLSQPQAFIDAAIFSEHVDYMVFASRYECAYEPEVQRAKGFLSSRGISIDLLGTWLPDPADRHGSEFLRHAPAGAGRPAAPTANLHHDSGYSSLSEPDQAIGQDPSKRRPRVKDIRPNKATTTKRSAIRPMSSVYSIKHRPERERTLLDMHPNVLPRVSRHPLATVTKPLESPSPPRGRQQNAREADEESRQQMPQPGLQSTPTAFNNTALQQSPQPDFQQQDARSAGPMNLRARSSLKETTAMALSREEQHFWGSGSDDDRQRATEPSKDPPTSSSPPTPHLLTLKIQDKDGLARLLRKTLPKVIGESNQVSPFIGAAMPNASTFLPFSTKMSAFSRGLLMGNAERRMLESTMENTFATPTTCVPVKALPRLTNLDSAAVDSTKRKTKRMASLSDIRPDASKFPRMLTDEAPATPANIVVSESVDNVDRLHIEAKKSYEPATVQMHPSSENSTPTKMEQLVPSTEPAKDTVTNVDHGVLPDAWRPRSPRSPSFSPISENEDLPEFQAILHGLMKHRLRVKVPAPGAVISSESNFGPTPTSSTFNADFDRRLNVVTPLQSGTSDQSKKDDDQKESTDNKKLKIKLIVKNADEVPSRSNTASPHPLSEEIRALSFPAPISTSDSSSFSYLSKKEKNKRGPRGPYKKTRERLEKEQREKELLEQKEMADESAEASEVMSGGAGQGKKNDGSHSSKLEVGELT